MKAKAITTSLDRYRSDAERAFAAFGKAIIEQHLNSPVLDLAYEPESFNLPGGSYTPDWRAILENCVVVFVEVKGSKHQRGYRDARSKLRAAAELNPWYTWAEVRLSLSRGEIRNFEFEVIK